ncbi:MAG TPA: glutamyl-tRNA reductase [Anaerolineales bacterium]|nr:glutamyl-tRNA reductase [Anaerolineales bacterium]
MSILSLGLNHLSTPVHLRERLIFNEEQIRSSLSRLNCGYLSANMAEMVILSTCNRIELYVVSNQDTFTELETFLSELHGVERDEFIRHLYHHKDMDVARHLFNVASGLDSLVVGEPQILGQVTRALEMARGQNTVGPILNRLFQSAVHAGKRARTETGISRNPTSVSSLAASLSQRVVHHIAEAQIVILGAGEMAELAVEALLKRGANRILVVNRTLERAYSLAHRWGAQATTFENLNAALASADIVIASTGAPHTIVTTEIVNQIMQARQQRPLVLIDIAVPRNIDPKTAHISYVRLYDIDNLKAQLEHSLAERMAEVPQVKFILEEELSQFEEYMKSLEMIPIIVDIRQQAEVIRQEVLEKALRRLPDLTETERDRIEAMTQALVKKLLEAPTHRLRAEASCPHAPEYAAVARTLFGLHKDDRVCGFTANACPIPCAAD